MRAQLGAEINVRKHEHHEVSGAISKTADALPGFGIVAAVLGIVVTMGHIDGPAEEIGHKVGAALVGTFLGILLSYGFFGPLAGRLDFQCAEEANFYTTIVNLTVSILEGKSPKEMVNQACRSIGSDVRPTHAELEQIFKEGDAGA
jgi:chemotaxis protein MotA